MNTLVRHLRLPFFAGLVFCITVPSAKADSACAAGNLSTLIGTTCDIGSLQFTFTGFASDNFSTNGTSSSSTTLYDDPLTPSDFTFTLLSNGFEITINNGPQSITAVADSAGQGTAEAVETADLYFDVTDLDGDITGMGALGAVGTTGPYTLSEISGTVTSSPNLFGERLEDDGGYEMDSLIDIGSPFVSGDGDAEIINMSGEDGDSVFWGGVSAFTFATGAAPAPTPEPGSLALLGSGALLLGAEIRRRYKTIR